MYFSYHYHGLRCMFPLSRLNVGFSSSIFGLCNFLVVSLLRPGLFFSPCCSLLLVHYILVFCGYYGVVLATLGPRTTQGSILPVQAVNHLSDYVYAVVGLRTVLEWDEGLIA